MPDATDPAYDQPDEPETKPQRSVPKPPPPDPAYVVADLLFRSCLRQAGLKRAHLPARGLVFSICVSQPDWIELFEKVWRDRVQNGGRAADGDGRGWHRDDASWAFWEADEEPDRLDRKREADTFAKSLAAGQNCVGITANIEWLPPDLVLSADYSIIVPPANGQVLGAAARLLTKTSPRIRLSDEQAALATPRLLRLAFRPGRQSADDYLCKLGELIEQDTQAEQPKPESPRNEPTLDRLHGMDEAVAWGFRLRDDLLAVQAGRMTWAELDRGCLLSGPPGCGKTLFARALAATTGTPLMSGSYSQWLGDGERASGRLAACLAWGVHRGETEGAVHPVHRRGGLLSRSGERHPQLAAVGRAGRQRVAD